MRFKAEDGSEWELEAGAIEHHDHLCIRRIPEKSELEEWVISQLPARREGDDCNHWYRIGLSEGIWKGFRKAIEVLTHEGFLVAAGTLKDLAGVK